MVRRLATHHANHQLETAMKRLQIDTKSLLIGFLSGLCAILTIAATAPSHPGWDLEFASEKEGYLMDLKTGKYQRVERVGPEGVLQRVGNPQLPR